jgi:hypothetical protein
MKRKAKLREKAALPPDVGVASAVEAAPPSIVERPDGYYWQAPDGHREFGPFERYDLAEADRDAVGDEALAPGESLREAEYEIGIADWIDPETGEPAEGGSPPHLQED